MEKLKIIENFPSKRSRSVPMNASYPLELVELFKSHSVKRTNCPLCGHFHSEIVQILAFDFKGFPCATGVCQNCGFVFLYEHLSEEALSINYSKFSTLVRGINLSSFESRRLDFTRRAESFAKDRFKYISMKLKSKPSLVVEIGANDGANLYPFYQDGIKTVGFDLDEESLSVGRSFGLEMSTENCFSYFEKNKPDVIILSHFLEHLINPKEFLLKLSSVLSEDAYVFVEVPGIKEQTWVNWKVGIIPSFQYEHLQYFEKSSMIALMESSGFSEVLCNEFIRGLFKNTKIKKENIFAKKFDGGEHLYQTEHIWEKSISRKIYSILSKIKSLLR